MGQSTIKLDDVQVFVEVVRAQSFSGAGRKLSLPKSTVSRRISDLEEALGTRLFERTTRRLHLTELGTSYYEQAARHIDDLQDAGRALLDQDDEPRGILKVTAPADLQIAEAILLYQQQHPKVRVVLYGTAARIDLISEGFDVAIRAGALPDSSLMARQVAMSRRWLVASPGYLLTAPPLRVLEDLKEHDCLVYSSQSSSETWAFEGPQGVELVEVSGRFACNSMETLVYGALRGQGVAFVPEGACYQALEGGQLQRVLSQFQSPAVPVSIVFPSSRMMTPKLRSFIDFIEREMKSWLKCPAFALESCKNHGISGKREAADSKSSAAP